LAVHRSGPPTRPDVLHLAFVLKKRARIARVFSGPPRLLGSRFPPKCVAKAAVFRLTKAEYHEVAVITAQRVRQRHRR
jgi:hypothetical protein